MNRRERRIHSIVKLKNVKNNFIIANDSIEQSILFQKIFSLTTLL